MIDKIHRAAVWLGDLSEKAKAVSAAVGTFAGVVALVTADEALGLDEVPTLLTAAATLATTVYAIVWRVPNEGFVKVQPPAEGDGGGK